MFTASSSHEDKTVMEPTISDDRVFVLQLIERSERFHDDVSLYMNQQTWSRPLENRIKHIISKSGNSDEVISRVALNARTTRPILIKRVAVLIEKYLEYKRLYGTETEKAIYGDNFSTLDMIQRLLICRPMVFMDSHDRFMMKGLDGVGGFDCLPTMAPDGLFSLRNLISYDEMQLGAMISMSVPTHFINEGSRQNRGMTTESHESVGVYVGSVGARFERSDKMEWAHVMVTSSQNTVSNGYGASANASHPMTQYLRMWARFYEQSQFPTYDEVVYLKENDESKFEERYYCHYHGFFDKLIYKERIRVVAEAYLRDANERVKEFPDKESAYVQVVGLGLGVWEIAPCQTELLVEAYAMVLRSVRLPLISHLNFSWIRASHCGGIVDGDIFRNTAAENPIRIHFSRRDPAERIDPQLLLVAQYAWDSNAFPGNEYWIGMLSASGDPAAACCSNISELQNPNINPDAFEASRTIIYD